MIRKFSSLILAFLFRGFFFSFFFSFLLVEVEGTSGSGEEGVRNANANSNLFRGKNVLLFITDQENLNTGAFPEDFEEKYMHGSSLFKKNGVAFTKAFAASCMCSPSRASLLTGFYPAQHKVRDTLEYYLDPSIIPQPTLSLRPYPSIMSYQLQRFQRFSYKMLMSIIIMVHLHMKRLKEEYNFILMWRI